MKFNDFLNDQLNNKELKKEYDKLAPKYEIISAIIKARNEKDLKRIADGLGQELHISFIPKQS